MQPLVFHPAAPAAPAVSCCADRPAILGGRVELQLLTTLKCNLKCSYCSLGVGEVLGSQKEVAYDLDQLGAFIERHLTGKEIYVTFYGGEPTLNREFMTGVMQRWPQFRYQLQTNGTLLDDLPDWVLANLSNVLISVDGGEKTTDGYRGRGIYRQVVRNFGKVREKIGGTVTARVTWNDPQTSFEEFDELASTFDYLYFQFVAGEAYTAESMEKRRAVMKRLVERFFADPSKLYPIIPLMGIVRNKLFPNRADELYHGLTQCRVSTHLLNIMPDGKVFPCPDMMYMPEMQQGDILDNWLKPSPLQPHADMPCEGCEAFHFCRRNCMKNLHLGYVKKDAQYRSHVVEPICELVRDLGRLVDDHKPAEWYARASVPVRQMIRDCEVYEYVEIMP